MNIAVTGGMGAGKSRVAESLAKMLGAMSVSADSICRELLEIPNPGYQQLRKGVSAEFFHSDGQINRPLLRKAIFSDTEQRTTIDDILHPLVREELFLMAGVAESRGVDLVAEVPLLFEKGWQADFDVCLVVFADDDICIKRIMERDHVSKTAAEESLRSQMPLVEKCKLGDWVIENSGDFAVTLKMISTIARKISAETLFRGKMEKG